MLRIVNSSSLLAIVGFIGLITLEEMTMNTYIEIKELIPVILDLGWIVKNDTWTDCPYHIYEQLEADYNCDALFD